MVRGGLPRFGVLKFVAASYWCAQPGDVEVVLAPFTVVVTDPQVGPKASEILPEIGPDKLPAKDPETGHAQVVLNVRPEAVSVAV